MKRKTIMIRKVRTSVKLEPEFWAYLDYARHERKLRISKMVEVIAGDAPTGCRPSAIRVWCLRDAMAVAEYAREEPAR